MFIIHFFKSFSGECCYELVTEDNICIGMHYCLSREFANRDLTEWRLKELQENNISEVYSNGELVWKDNKMTNDTKDNFRKATAEYEDKYCIH